MAYYIAVISALLVATSAVPISRQLGGISGDVQVLTLNGTEKCQVDGRLYERDDDLPTEDPCEYCTCQPPGFACQVVKCEHKPECRALQRSGLCCPEYVCDCEFEGKIYQNGDKISDNENKCEDCYCVTGEVVCSVIQCASPPSNCQIIQDTNRCCATFDCSNQGQDDQNSTLLEETKTEVPERVFDASNPATEQDNQALADDKSEQSSLNANKDEEDVYLNVIYHSTENPEESTDSAAAPDLDTKENEYWLSQLKASSGSQKKEAVSAAAKDPSPLIDSVTLENEQLREEDTTEKGDLTRVEHVTDENFNEIEPTGTVKSVETEQLINTKLNSEDVQTQNEKADTTEVIETRTEGYNEIEAFEEKAAEFSATERSVVDEAETQEPDRSEEETQVVSKISKIEFNVEELIKLKDSSVSVTVQPIETRTEQVAELQVFDENMEFTATERNADEESNMLLTATTVEESEMNFDAAEISETKIESSELSGVTLTPEIETRTEQVAELQAFDEDVKLTVTERSFDDEASIILTEFPVVKDDLVNKIPKIKFNVEELIKTKDDNADSDSETTQITETNELSELEVFEDSVKHEAEFNLATTSSPSDDMPEISFSAEELADTQNDNSVSVDITTPSIETRTDEQSEREALEENMEFTATERSANEPSIVTLTDIPTEKLEVVNKISKISFDVEELIKSQYNNIVSETTEIIETRTDKDTELETFYESLPYSVTERNAEEKSSFSATEIPLEDVVDDKLPELNFNNDLELSAMEDENLESVRITTPVIETRTDKLSELKAFDEIMEFTVTEKVVDDESSMILEDVNKISKTIFNVEVLIKAKNPFSNSETMQTIETGTDKERLDQNLEYTTTEESVGEEIFAFTRSSGEPEPEILSKISSQVSLDEDKSVFVQDTTDIVETRTENLNALDDLQSEVLEFGITEVLEESDKGFNNLTHQNETDSPAQIPVSKVEASSKNQQESKVEDKNDYWLNMADKKDEIESNVAPKVPQAESLIPTAVEVATFQNEAAERDGEFVTEEASLSNDIIPEDEAALSFENSIRAVASVEATQVEELTDNAVIRENEDLDSKDSAVEKKEDAGAQPPSEAEEKLEDVDSQEDAAVTEDSESAPKKQRIEMQIKHLSKKFGLRPLTRRTFSNDIEERRKTRLRDRKMILNRNRQSVFH